MVGSDQPPVTNQQQKVLRTPQGTQATRLHGGVKGGAGQQFEIGQTISTQARTKNNIHGPA